MDLGALGRLAHDHARVEEREGHHVGAPRQRVLHEPGDGGESVVVDVLRSGYLWKGKVLRPAMVKVRG